MYAEVEQIIFNKGKPRAAITLPFTAVWGKLIATKLLLKVFFSILTEAFIRTMLRAQRIQFG